MRFTFSTILSDSQHYTGEVPRCLHTRSGISLGAFLKTGCISDSLSEQRLRRVKGVGGPGQVRIPVELLVEERQPYGVVDGVPAWAQSDFLAKLPLSSPSRDARCHYTVEARRRIR